MKIRVITPLNDTVERIVEKDGEFWKSYSFDENSEAIIKGIGGQASIVDLIDWYVSVFRVSERNGGKKNRVVILEP